MKGDLFPPSFFFEAPGPKLIIFSQAHLLTFRAGISYNAPMNETVQARVNRLFREYGAEVLVSLTHHSKKGNLVERLGTIDTVHEWGITLKDIDKGFRSVRFDSIKLIEIA